MKRRWKIIQRDGLGYPTASPVPLDDPEGQFDSETETYESLAKQAMTDLNQTTKDLQAAQRQYDAAWNAYRNITRLLDLCIKAGS